MSPYESKYSRLSQGLVIKVDSVGKELWRMPILEDTGTVTNLVVMPLKNGNFLASYYSGRLQPFRAPPSYNHPNEQINMLAYQKFIEFTDKAEIVRRYDFKELLRPYIKGTFFYVNHIFDYHIEPDGSIILTGLTSDGNQEVPIHGFLMKLDNQGNYEWYRQYVFSVSKPYNIYEKEFFWFYGITKLHNGNFALSGEYRGHPSDSFDTYVQKGLLLIVDSMGCAEKDCHLKGCTDSQAQNFNPTATIDDGSCTYLKCDSSYMTLEFLRFERIDHPYIYDIHIEGMRDSIVYYNKNIYDISHQQHISSNGLDYSDFRDTTCLPRNGQCYKVTIKTDNYWNRYYDVSLEYTIDGKNRYYQTQLNSTEIKDHHFFIKDGEYYFESCESDSLPKVPNLPNKMNSWIKLYPNPFSKSFQIDIMENAISDAKVEIYNSIGQQIKTLELLEVKTTILMSHYPSGLYHIIVRRSDGIFETHKIIKQ